jgi:hypothetical protein
VSIVRIIRIATICGAMAAACAAADEGAKPPSPESAGWWTKSSLSAATMPTKVLLHFQGTLSFMNAEGNTVGSSFDTKGDLLLRRWRFTNHFTADYIRRDVVYGNGGGAVDTTESTIRNHVDFDLTKHFSAVAGIERYENTLMFMDRRLTAYTGLGAEIVHAERHQVYLVAGFGQSDFLFDRDAMLRINPTAVATLKTTDPDSTGTLLMQNWNWKITKMVTFHQDGSYMDFSHAELGNRWSLGFDLNVAVAKRFSLALGYQARHDDNAFVRALGVKSDDRTFTTGIRLTL